MFCFVFCFVLRVCDFLKKCAFWSKFDITNVFLGKFLYENVYFMYFYELIKKLCYKIKKAKRDV